MKVKSEGAALSFRVFAASVRLRCDERFVDADTADKTASILL